MLLYSEMIACGVWPNVFIVNVLVHSFVKVGNLSFALELLRSFGAKNIIDTVTYNTLIWGFFVKGFCGIGLVSYEEWIMYNLTTDGICKDVIGFNILIDGYCKSGDINYAMELMDRIRREGLVPDIISYNTLINGFCKTGDFFMAKSLIVEILGSRRRKDLNILAGNCNQKKVENGVVLEPNFITHTMLISAYCKQEVLEEALSLYEEMVANGILPDAITYSSIINGLRKHVKLAEAKILMMDMEMERMGVDPNHVSYATLMNMFFKVGNSMDAFTLKSLMVVRDIVFDVVVYTILMDGLFKVGKPKESMFITLLKHKLVPNTVTYSTLVHGLCKLGDINGAESALEEMKEKYVVPNVVTYSSIINKYVRKGILDEAVNIMRKMMGKNIFPNVYIYAALIDGYFKAGKETVALDLYNEMKLIGLVENSFILDAFVNNLKRSGRMWEADELAKDMMSRGLSLDHVNYTSLMDSFFKEGKESAALTLA
ncbi:hypothetical protein V6N11_009455 [Hibiscus sabdariffa]|uniref:Pentatricopeptide repeat-containing protein n=1 Tax=Hibiscus sabdariffa TaxID=183260 RepID=A0ABR2P5H0_9ROSI